MNRTKPSIKIALAALLVAWLSGCAAPPVKERLFWPTFPDEPRIEWLGAYRNQNDFPVTGFKKLVGSIAGEEEPVKFVKPIGIYGDGEGKVYVADLGRREVLVYDLVNYDLHVFGGTKATGVFQEPMGIAQDGAGSFYIVDSGSKKVLVFDREENALRAIDLTKVTTRPVGIALDRGRGRIIVVDVTGHKLEFLDLQGNHLFSRGKRGGEDGEFNFPTAVALMRNGNIVVADSMNTRVQLLDPDGKFIRKFGRRGDSPGEFQIPKGIAVDSEDHIYVTDGKGNNIGIFSEQGDYLLTVGGTYAAELRMAPGGFLIPQGIAIDGKDTIYVVDQMNYRFQVFQYMNERYRKEHPVEPPQQPAAK